MKRIFYLLLPTLLLLASCQTDKADKSQRSIYYWSTTWDMDSSKTDFIRRHHIQRIYLRYFDVVKEESGEVKPNATLQVATPMEKGTEIVPVVFIVNDCMRDLSPQGSRDLAGRILKRILQMSKANDIHGVREIQMDCDWTASTQETYFTFLKTLREKTKEGKILLSATIRLHQLSMAPPPVDRGVLMMYNTGDAKKLDCHKPILDMRDAAPYIQHLGSYPLPSPPPIPSSAGASSSGTRSSWASCTQTKTFPYCRMTAS